MNTTASTTALTRPAAPVASEPVTLGRTLRSEWIKFGTLRSTLAVLVAAVLAMVALALIIAYNTRHLTPNLDAEDIVQSATLQGYDLDQLLIGALGVLFVTGEYSTGMIRATFAAVPRRLPVFWAKLIVFTSLVATSMTAISFVAFLAAQALLAHYRPGFSLSDPGVLRVVIGTGIYLTLVGMIGTAIGWIVRSTPGALVTYAAVVLVLPALLGAFASTGRWLAQFTPTRAGEAFSQTLPDTPHLLPYIGLTVMIAWTTLALTVAATLLRRRDA